MEVAIDPGSVQNEMTSSCEDHALSANLVSFKDAFSAKYCEEAFEAEEFNYISTSPGRRAPQLNNRQRTILSLSGHKINFAGLPGEISEICPSVEDLDLGRNALNDWFEVLLIISQLQKLEVLNLSENPLSSSADISSLYDKLPIKIIPSSLKQLALDNTHVPLETVFSLLKLMTSVQDLYLCRNGYTKVPESKDTFPSIRRLYLSGHSIGNWEQINKLGEMFPSLEELVMTDCNLESITPEKAVDNFPQLKVLNLNKSKLCDWSAVDALCAFPCLMHVSLLGIPLLKPLNDLLKRQFVIARIPNITHLNKTMISTQEREDAERRFIRHYMEEEDRPNRYQELVDVHGTLQKLADVNLAPQANVTLSIHFEDHTPFPRAFDVKHTTTRFKKDLGDIIGLSPSDFRVFFRNVGAFVDEMRFGSRLLYQYKFEDGDEIHIQKKFGV